jgi:nucleoside-diphosphate-sugar epimerase
VKIICTGGAGFIGSHLVRELIKRKHQVIVVDNLSSGKLSNLPAKGFVFHQMDIRDPKLASIMKGADAVFHYAAIPGVPYSVKLPEYTHLVNVTGTLNVLECAKQCKVKRFIYASSSAVYEDNGMIQKEFYDLNPSNPYGAQKNMGEIYCKLYNKMYGMETISLRFFNVFGPRQNIVYAAVIPVFLTMAVADLPPSINGDGQQIRDLTYVDNVVSASILAMNTKDKNCFGESFNIANGYSMSINEVWEVIKKKTKCKAEAVHNKKRKGDIKYSFADISKAKNLLKYKVVVNFNEGIDKTIEGYK